ncbi:C4-dicarboxylate transport sensor protein dctB [Actibacterium atlanticum]|uniref:histidine kinase n=1 Tax=Actibacterium atlanticum TaxID=1461693 RepID=A0A058ZJM5_9RHOB|nr:ATP-binding protein [Actibacterium atlanticum]KCV81430.1 C4-dicarboxylate transport sensor protein dctB [Actibacterium atlanticum]
MRSLPALLISAAVVAVAVVVQIVSYDIFRAQELSRSEGRLSLYRSTVTAELERFSHLTQVLAQDVYVMAAALGAEAATLNPRLKGFSDSAGLDAIYLMTTDGLTVAASNYDQPISFLGGNYAFRPYFQDAVAGQQGRYYAIGATTGLPGYFIADAVQSKGVGPVGVIAIKLDLSKLEESWRSAGEQVLLSNADGVVLLASDPAWRYRLLAPLEAEARAEIVAERQFPGQALQELDWTRERDQRATISGVDRLHLTSSDLPHGWELHYFASDDRAVTRSWLATALAVFAAGVVLVLVQVQRTRRMGAALQRSELEEAALRQANKQLAFEITERRAAERRLKRTQGELERASRLAALGRLSASVTHELGQPIAAMRNHLAAAELNTGNQARLPTRITELVDRMEGITRQLKFFARSEDRPFEEVDLSAAMKAALALVETNIQANDVATHFDLPNHPIILRGSRLRIEQVMTNLLRNAVDAVEDSAAPAIWISVDQSAAESWFEIRDNGHGLGEATLADLQEPFVTTRESGRGMGLGLAISASIVNDHGGEMTARNADRGGAVFRVVFPRSETDTSEAA